MNKLTTFGGIPSLGYLKEDILSNDNWFSPITNGDSVPAINISENETEFEVEIAAPGCHRQDFKVSLQEGILSISAEISKQVNDRVKNFTQKELSYSSFNRSFTIPKNIVKHDVKARYKNGLLHISLKKVPDEKSTRKQVNE